METSSAISGRQQQCSGAVGSPVAIDVELPDASGMGHDLRRTFATGLARQGTAIHVTEKILNHVSGALGGVAGIYNRFAYWDDQVKALDQWEQYVVSLAARPQPPPSVGDIKRGRPSIQYQESAMTPSLG